MAELTSRLRDDFITSDPLTEIAITEDTTKNKSLFDLLNDSKRFTYTRTNARSFSKLGLSRSY